MQSLPNPGVGRGEIWPLLEVLFRRRLCDKVRWSFLMYLKPTGSFPFIPVLLV